MKPLDLYRIAIKNKEFEYNTEQHMIIKMFDDLHGIITEDQKANLFSKAFRVLNRTTWRNNKKKSRLFYIWGDVGSGKTFVADTFYYSAPTSKARMHYHDFLKYIDNKMRYFQGKTNPIKSIVKDITRNLSVLCIDEMCINEISDAITTAKILETLAKSKICILITSNTKPDDIYSDGIQRERIVSFIKKIQNDFVVIELFSKKDYRLESKVKFSSENPYPIQHYTNIKAKEIFFSLSQEKNFTSRNISVLRRDLPIIKESINVLWVSFISLFGRPRSKHDYIEIVKKYQTIIITDIDHIKSREKNKIFCFVQFVDVVYDLRKSTVISGRVPIKQIYTKGPYKQVFNRTISRLKEISRGYDIY